MDWSKLILGVGSTVSAIFMGLETMGIFPDIQFINHAVMLIMLGSILLVELTKEKNQEIGFSFSNLGVNDFVTMVLVAASFLFAALSLLRIPVPAMMFGAVGFLYIVLAIVMIVKILRD